MAIEADDFRTFTGSGITIERDTRTKTRLLKLASKRLAEKRRGTELDDHLSGDIICPRRSVLDRISALNKTKDSFVPVKSQEFVDNRNPELEHSRTYDVLYDPTPLIQDLDAQKVIFFGFGHAFQDFIFGDDAEIAMWDDEKSLWYSPDGVELFDENDFYEFKTTRQSPIRADFRKAGFSIEDTLAFKNDSWFKYILAVMHRTNTREYSLTVGWIVSAEFETFKITATDEAIERNEVDLAGQRKIRRDSLANLISFNEYGKLVLKETTASNLPPLNLRNGMYECDYCHWAAREPCASEIPAQNALEKLRIKEAKAESKRKGEIYLER